MQCPTISVLSQNTPNEVIFIQYWCFNAGIMGPTVVNITHSLITNCSCVGRNCRNRTEEVLISIRLPYNGI